MSMHQRHLFICRYFTLHNIDYCTTCVGDDDTCWHRESGIHVELLNSMYDMKQLSDISNTKFQILGNLACLKWNKKWSWSLMLHQPSQFSVLCNRNESYCKNMWYYIPSLGYVAYVIHLNYFILPIQLHPAHKQKLAFLTLALPIFHAYGHKTSCQVLYCRISYLWELKITKIQRNYTNLKQARFQKVFFHK